jgi:hypothetical protein
MAESKSGSGGVAAFIWSIVGLLGICPILGSILGIVLGAGESEGLGRAGYILGWIGLLLVAIPLILLLILAVVGVIAVPLAESVPG